MLSNFLFSGRLSLANSHIRKGRHFILIALALLLTVFSTPCFTQSSNASSDEKTNNPLLSEPHSALMKQALDLLKSKSFKDKKKAVSLISESGDKATLAYLEALLSASLYIRKSDGEIVTAKKSGKKYILSKTTDSSALGTAAKRDVKKITINNSLRSLLRRHIAVLTLQSPDAAVRMAAVKEMINKNADTLGDALRAVIDDEQDQEVHELMENGIALSDLNSTDREKKLAALDKLSSNLNSSVRNKLKQITTSNNEDPDVIASAHKTLQLIEEKVKYYGMLETLFFGLSLGSILVLAAIGLAITFGVMGVINMAHGELIMLGAYTTYLIQQAIPSHIGWSLLIAIPAAFLISGGVGILIERTVIRFLYGRPLETLLATFGVSLILQQLVRTVISPQNVPVSNPHWMSGSLQINEVLSLTYNRVYIIFFCLMVFLSLFMILKKTRLGLQVRAVSQNRAMAKAMGVHSNRVDALTFGLGAGIAGIAGVALSQLTNVGPNLGQTYIIDSFMVVVFGGVGNLMGTLVAGVSLGVANKIIEPWAGAVLAKVLVLVFIILFIQKNPRGLFPQKGRAAEN